MLTMSLYRLQLLSAFFLIFFKKWENFKQVDFCSVYKVPVKQTFDKTWDASYMHAMQVQNFFLNYLSAIENK